MKVINFTWKLLSDNLILSFIVFRMWFPVLINYNLGSTCWEENLSSICWKDVRENFLLKWYIWKKKKYDKKVLCLTKGMLQIATPY